MTAEPPRLKLAVRIGLSLFVIWQLVALVAPPLAFQTRGPIGNSPSVSALLTPVRAYGQLLYVDRGYAFFAPDPGPSHLIQAAVTDGAGRRSEIMIPNLEVHWPRLRYHRHFMLAEFLTEIYQPPGPPQEMVEADPVAARFWLQGRARYEYVRQSIVDHLKRKNPGHDVAIRRIEHLIPSFQDSIELTDPQLYTVLLDRPLLVGSEMELPSGPPEAIPAPKAGDTAAAVTGEPTDTVSGNERPTDQVKETDPATDADQSKDKGEPTESGDEKQESEPLSPTDDKAAPADAPDAENAGAPDAEGTNAGSGESTEQAEAS